MQSGRKLPRGPGGQENAALADAVAAYGQRSGVNTAARGWDVGHPTSAVAVLKLHNESADRCYIGFWCTGTSSRSARPSTGDSTSPCGAGFGCVC